jgi:hypothetical protein
VGPGKGSPAREGKMRRIYAKDEKNQIPEAILYWEGPGYYASGQRWGDARHCPYEVIYRVGVDPEDYDQASREARMQLLGSPIWADSPQEALGTYEIIAWDETPEINSERYSEIVVKHLRESFDCLKI